MIHARSSAPSNDSSGSHRALCRRLPCLVGTGPGPWRSCAEEFNEYLSEVARQLRAHGIRVDLDFSDDRFGKKIRNASKSKVPFILIAGGEDRDAGAVSFRFRDGSQLNGVPVAQAVERIRSHITSRVNTDPGAE